MRMQRTLAGGSGRKFLAQDDAFAAASDKWCGWPLRMNCPVQPLRHNLTWCRPSPRSTTSLIGEAIRHDARRIIDGLSATIASPQRESVTRNEGEVRRE